MKVNGFWYNRSLFPNQNAQVNSASDGAIEIAPRDVNTRPAQGTPPRIRSVSRKPQDIAIEQNNPNPPAAKKLVQSVKPKVKKPLFRVLSRDADVQDIRVNQQQVNASGTRVGINRPDLQFSRWNRVTNVLERFYLEWDRSSSGRGMAHAKRSLANDPDVIMLLFTLD